MTKSNAEERTKQRPVQVGEPLAGGSPSAGKAAAAEKV